MGIRRLSFSPRDKDTSNGGDARPALVCIASVAVYCRSVAVDYRSDVVLNISEYRAQDIEASEVGKGRDVQAVVVHDKSKELRALTARETEHMHRGVFHAHDFREQGGEAGREEVGVHGAACGEGGVFKVEEHAVAVVVEVGIEGRRWRCASSY